MNKPKTHMILIIDKSGSMSRTKSTTLVGLNEQIQQCKEWSEEQDVKFSLISFNGSVQEHLWNESSDKIEELKNEDYNPRGSTNLLDAMGQTFQKIENLIEAEKDEKYKTAFLVTVITDGENTVRGKFTYDGIKESLDSLESSGSFTLNFIGCNRNSVLEVAKKIGMRNLNNMAFYSNSNEIKNTTAYQNVTKVSNDFAIKRAKSFHMGEELYCSKQLYNSAACDISESSSNDVVSKNVSEKDNEKLDFYVNEYLNK